MKAAGECQPLRRTVWAVLLGRGFGGLLILTAATLLWAAAVEGESAYVVGAGCCGVLHFLASTRQLLLCRGALVTRRLLTPDRRFPLVDISRVEVGKVREGYGYSGYSGYAMVIEMTSGTRITVEQSRYCGQRRLEEWAVKIGDAAAFSGTLHTTSDVIRGGRQ